MNLSFGFDLAQKIPTFTYRVYMQRLTLLYGLYMI